MTVDALTDALRAQMDRDPAIVGWEVAETRGRGAQRMYRGVAGKLLVYQSRTVRDRSIRLTVWVRAGDAMGAGVVDVDPNLAPGPQVAFAVDVAGTSANHPWTLPIPPAEDYPEVDTADAGIVENPAATLGRIEVGEQRHDRAPRV